MEPAVGIEPTTDGLQNRCSTAELSWRPLCCKALRKTFWLAVVFMVVIKTHTTEVHYSETPRSF